MILRYFFFYQTLISPSIGFFYYLPLVSRPNDIDAKARLGTISSSVGDDGISGELSVQVPIIAPWMDSSHLFYNQILKTSIHHKVMHTTNRFFSLGDSAVNS